MNRRNQPYNRMLQNSSYYPRNNHSSFNPITRRPRFNKRLNPKFRRNRLQRVQNVINYTRNYQRPYQQRAFNNTYNNQNNGNTNSNMNNNREIYVKGLPRFVDNQGLFNLFRNEGKIINCHILYDNVGFSRGIGRILFANFRDAVNVIKKWNNTDYKGNTLKVEYKTVKSMDNKNNTYNNFQNKNNNNYFRPYNFNQGNKYGYKFRPKYYFNNYNNVYNRYRVSNNNRY